MKKINFPKIIWLTCLFLDLILILIMVMDYKIHYQHQTKNNLYFYECSGNLCVTEVKDEEHLLYSYYECGYEECPAYKKEIGDSHILITKDNKNILYNYRTSTVISQDYEDYQFINNQYIIVTKNKKQGIIDINNNIMIEPIYDELGYPQDGYLTGYNLNNILAKKDDKYGIISLKVGEVTEPFEYSEDKVNELLEKIKTEDID